MFTFAGTVAIQEAQNSVTVDYGMVQDGTKCSDQKICMNQTCVSTSPLKSYMRCPVDTSNMECSGRGVSYWVWFDANILYLHRKVLGYSEYYLMHLKGDYYEALVY